VLSFVVTKGQQETRTYRSDDRHFILLLEKTQRVVDRILDKPEYLLPFLGYGDRSEDWMYHYEHFRRQRHLVPGIYVGL
jgi:hypothetical protein